jgi:hypothetical protein
VRNPFRRQSYGTPTNFPVPGSLDVVDITRSFLSRRR